MKYCATRFLVLFGFAATTALAAFAQDSIPPLEAEARALAKRCLERSGADGLSLAVHIGGVETLRFDCGSLSVPALEEAPPVDARPLLETLLAVAAFQAAERGHWKLDQRVHAVASELGLADSELTIDQLLSHTAGLATLAELLRVEPQAFALPRAALIARAATLARVSAGGECFGYSDTHAFALERALSSATSVEPRTWIAERILKPCGIEPVRLHAAERDALATGWTSAGGTEYSSYGAHVLGAVEFELNASEIARLCNGLTSERVLAPDSWRSLSEPAHERAGPSARYAHGLTLAPQGVIDGYQFGGAIGATRVSATLYPDPRVSIAIVLTGPGADDGDPIAEFERRLSRSVLGLEEPAFAEVALSAEERALYVGMYQIGCQAYRVEDREGALFFAPPSGNVVRLVHGGARSFTAANDREYRVTFAAETGRPADTVTIDDHGVRSTARRFQ
jgi:CubicO group peptidase (beta-lactamase class C family)